MGGSSKVGATLVLPCKAALQPVECRPCPLRPLRGPDNPRGAKPFPGTRACEPTWSLDTNSSRASSKLNWGQLYGGGACSLPTGERAPRWRCRCRTAPMRRRGSCWVGRQTPWPVVPALGAQSPHLVPLHVLGEVNLDLGLVDDDVSAAAVDLHHVVVAPLTLLWGWCLGPWGAGFGGGLGSMGQALAGSIPCLDPGSRHSPRRRKV